MHRSAAKGTPRPLPVRASSDERRTDCIRHREAGLLRRQAEEKGGSGCRGFEEEDEVTRNTDAASTATTARDKFARLYMSQPQLLILIMLQLLLVRAALRWYLWHHSEYTFAAAYVGEHSNVVIPSPPCCTKVHYVNAYAEMLGLSPEGFLLLNENGRVQKSQTTISTTMMPAAD